MNLFGEKKKVMLSSAECLSGVLTMFERKVCLLYFESICWKMESISFDLSLVIRLILRCVENRTYEGGSIFFQILNKKYNRTLFNSKLTKKMLTIYNSRLCYLNFIYFIFKLL